MTDRDLKNMAPEEIQRIFDALEAENEALRHAFEEQQDQAALLTIITGNMSDIVTLIEKKGKILFTGKSIKIIGYDPDFVSGKNIMDFVHPEDVPQVMDAHNRLMGSGEARRIEYRCRCKDGNYLWIETRGTYVPDENSDEPKILLISRDITERKQAEQKMVIRLKLISYASDHSLSELMTKALDEVEQILNSAISFLHFVEPDQKNLALQQWSTATLERFCKASGRGLHYSIHRAGVWADCVRERKGLIHNNYVSMPNKKGLPEGHAEVIREMVVPVLRQGVIVAIMGVGNKPTDYTQEDLNTLTFLSDVTWEVIANKQMEEELIRLAATDNLTGLLNRRVFMEKLAEEIKRRQRYGKAAVVMMLDLDHFKAINDTYGHAGGDTVLREFARLLIENIRETDVAGRLGGEEFAVLLPETTMDAAMVMAQRILNHIRKSVVSIEAGDVRFTVSIGFAQLDDDDFRTDRLLAKADAALYRAKGKGRDRAEACQPKAS